MCTEPPYVLNDTGFPGDSFTIPIDVYLRKSTPKIVSILFRLNLPKEHEGQVYDINKIGQMHFMGESSESGKFKKSK